MGPGNNMAVTGVERSCFLSFGDLLNCLNNLCPSGTYPDTFYDHKRIILDL